MWPPGGVALPAHCDVYLEFKSQHQSHLKQRIKGQLGHEKVSSVSLFDFQANYPINPISMMNRYCGLWPSYDKFDRY